MRILLQSAIAHLDEAEHALDDAEDVFNLRPHFRLGPVLRLLDLVDHAMLTIAAIGEVLRLWRTSADHVLLTAVGLVTSDAGFVPVQQVRQDRAVGDIRRRGHH